MADSANTTTKSTLKQGGMAELDTLDCIRSVALVVMFFSMTFKDKKTWLWADSIGALFIGLFHFIRPEILIKQISYRDEDNLQCYIVQACAAFMLADAVYRYWAGQSRDEAVLSSLIWSRVISLSVMTVIGFYTHYSPKSTFRPEHLSFVMLSNCAWLVSALIQLWRYVNPLGGVEKTGPVVWLLRLDFFILFVTALVHLAYPGWLLSFQLRRGNVIHRYLVRIIGSVFLGIAIQAQQASIFRNEADRIAYFFSRIASYVLVGVALAYSYLYEDLFNRRELMCATVVLLHALPSVIGLFLTVTGRSGAECKPKYYSSSTYYTRSSTKHAF